MESKVSRLLTCQRQESLDSIKINKNLPSTMGRERIPAVPPKLVALNTVKGQTRFMPTNIGFPITLGRRLELLWIHSSGSRGNFDWFLLSAILSYACTSLATSTNLLSSVIAIGKARLLGVIIVRIGRLSSLNGCHCHR